MSHKLTVGQELWAVFSGRHRADRETAATVTKVGRKWATIKFGDYGESRIDMETLRLDGHFVSGCCYLSRADYETARDRDEAWSALCRAIYDSRWGVPPKDVTLADIVAARKLLRFE